MSVSRDSHPASVIANYAKSQFYLRRQEHGYLRSNLRICRLQLKFLGNGKRLESEIAADNARQITTNSSVSDKAFEAANFSATWEFPIGPVDEPVHAFPNAMLDLPDIIPLTLSNLSAFTLDVSWTYGLGDYVHNVTDFASMSAAEVNANVCLDMFLAADPSNSTNTTTATYEVMVWLGRWGDASQPIGLAQGPVASQTVNGTTL